ncbi:MAG: hypothetical protein IPL53_21380 [Ignavibacteria bacterium]|nr:hypothetical protein [Ignavibacteria bacterium]
MKIKIMVFIEMKKDQIRKSSLEALSLAAYLINQLGGQIGGFIMGKLMKQNF